MHFPIVKIILFVNFQKHICILKPQWSVFKVQLQREEEASLAWRQCKYNQNLEKAASVTGHQECHSSLQALPSEWKQPLNYTFITYELLDSFIDSLIEQLSCSSCLSRRQFTHCYISYQLGNTGSCFFPFLLMSELRGDAPSSFRIHLVSAHICFLLFNTTLFASLQLVPGNNRNTCSSSLFPALLISFQWVEKNVG